MLHRVDAVGAGRLGVVLFGARNFVVDLVAGVIVSVAQNEPESVGQIVVVLVVRVVVVVVLLHVKVVKLGRALPRRLESGERLAQLLVLVRLENHFAVRRTQAPAVVVVVVGRIVRRIVIVVVVVSVVVNVQLKLANAYSKSCQSKSKEISKSNF